MTGVTAALSGANSISHREVDTGGLRTGIAEAGTGPHGRPAGTDSCTMLHLAGDVFALMGAVAASWAPAPAR